MKKDITNQLRRFASVPGKERTWVSDLTDDQLYELFLRLRSGESSASIARRAQEGWKVSPRSSAHSVSQGILKFKQRIAHLLLLSSQPSPGAVSTLDLPLGLEEDALETLETIAQQYEARIQRMIAEEKETGVRYPHINRDLQALASLRKAILKQKEWDSTHDDPLKRKEYERMEKRMDRRFKGLLEYLGDDGQDRLIQSMDKFLELVEKEALPMYRKGDGTYTLSDPEERQKESPSK